MNDKTLTIRQTARDIIVPDDATKDAKSQLRRFANYQAQAGRKWHDLDLVAYRDALARAKLAPASVSAHLSTVRARYHAILRDARRRDELWTLAGDHLQELGQDDSPANRAAFVTELEKRIQHAIDPATAPVKMVIRQDRPDSEHRRLTSEQANALMRAPGTGTLRGLRDTAVIALLLCTGIREAELCALDVGDLRQRLGGELALHVREGKGCKERLVPYGALSGVLALVDGWCDRAGIEHGAVFRGVHRSGKVLDGRLSVRSVQNIVTRYPVAIDGDLVTVRPHDLRRTYAARLYHAGVDLVAIQQNLGHADSKTTLGYIGTLDADQRRAPAIYSLNGLFSQSELGL